MSDTSTAQPAYAFPPTDEIVKCPYPHYAELRDEQPVYQAEGGEYVISRYADVKEVFRDGTRFRTPPIRGDEPIRHFNEKEDPEHKNRRKLFQRVVSPGHLKAYSPMMRQLADRLIDDFRDDGSVDFLAAFANPYPVFVIAGLMDLPEEDFDWHRWLDGFEGSAVRYISPVRREAYQQRNESLFAYVKQVIEARIERPRDDLFGQVVAARQAELGDQPLEGDLLDDLVADGKAVIGAATANTTYMLANTIKLLVEHPHVMSAVRADRSLLVRVVEESMRLESPVQWTPRVAKVGTEISGVEIPAGSRLILLLGSANRDAEQFAEPERFESSRGDLRKQIGFGFGSYTCLGAPLARVEGQIALDALLDRLDDIDIPPGGWEDGTHVEFRGPSRLEITYRRA